MPWAAAIALGAIVAPPDAAAATAILRQVKLPYRLLKILEGESLLNDASALLIYRVAVGARCRPSISNGASTRPRSRSHWSEACLPAILCARLWTPVDAADQGSAKRDHHAFAGTFTLWIVAEHIGLSGILTIVAYAITLARTAPAETPARLRVPTYAVWDTVVFVLNVLAFVLIGLQLRPIWERLDDRRAAEILPGCRRRARHRDPHPHRLGDVVRRRAARS